MTETADPLSQLQLLLEAFQDRAAIYDEITANILEMLSPTLLAALIQLFESDAVVWTSVAVEETTLSVVCTVFYEKDKKLPLFMDKLTPAGHVEEYKNKISRTVRIGVPVAFAFAGKTEILEYLVQMVNTVMQEKTDKPSREVPITTDETPSDETSTFDASKLTKEQVLNMLVFQHQTKGTKH